ncbi:FAD-dependent monooxygenase [Streptoalloteichus hindustanus]|uniref:2-polyprenyl-6-methoxyphenol hydroxylase n=1 Tax=Streptoalloteichus hindustanus TaxID=2017 RepID=A0A1M5F5N3_STRHI|nr:FAD-dependent monooxygenase [Streptoalloteichus hindustanus]SHF86819.1 2-polyprenyl-6-methoxyphenol hydroxylase [Streptoalloteichus hindustanus]
MRCDVVIVGAGPNGLMLAGELCLAGVRPLLLERLPGRTGESRANGLVGQVVRMLDRRGVYEALAGDRRPPQPAPFFVFGALPLDLGSLADNPLYALPVPQHRVEEVLEERAVALGAEIRRGHELTALSQDTDSVTVTVLGPDGPYQLRARYLVGADGGHSVTRKLSGIGFPGVTRDNSVSRSAHVSVPAGVVDPETGGLRLPGQDVIPPFLHHRTDRGLFAFAPLPSRAPLVNTTEWDSPTTDSQTPLTFDELRESVRRVLGVDLSLGPPEGPGPHLLRRLTGGNTRLAERFRDRRVLLLGDAAHVHAAIGGPGLNLGLQDAVNLGWKLAAEIHGWAPPGLLDSYEAERRPAARRVVTHTQAQAALTAPGPDVTALRELFGELLTDQRNVQHIAAMMSGADLCYDMGVNGAHPLVGRWAPDLELTTVDGPTRLAELTRTARPLLVDLTGDASLVGELSGWDDRVDAVAGTAQDTGNTPAPASALLLRPDCYVAWATSSAHPDQNDRKTLRTALTRWFGPAS